MACLVNTSPPWVGIARNVPLVFFLVPLWILHATPNTFSTTPYFLMVTPSTKRDHRLSLLRLAIARSSEDAFTLLVDSIRLYQSSRRQITGFSVGTRDTSCGVSKCHATQTGGRAPQHKLQECRRPDVCGAIPCGCAVHVTKKVLFDKSMLHEDVRSLSSRHVQCHDFPIPFGHNPSSGFSLECSPMLIFERDLGRGLSGPFESTYYSPFSLNTPPPKARYDLTR